MIVTQQIIEAGKSINGGWNLQQMKCLGFENGWERKWIRRIVGKDLPEENIKRFLDWKNAHINRPKAGKALQNKKDFWFEPITKEIKYAEQYQHPNWQKMRLIILKRDCFKCVNCGNRDNTLHAHHIKYIGGKFIWEVPHWYIVTLCEDCHSEEHNKDLRSKSKSFS